MYQMNREALEDNGLRPLTGIFLKPEVNIAGSHSQDQHDQ